MKISFFVFCFTLSLFTYSQYYYNGDDVIHIDENLKVRKVDCIRKYPPMHAYNYNYKTRSSRSGKIKLVEGGFYDLKGRRYLTDSIGHIGMLIPEEVIDLYNDCYESVANSILAINYEEFNLSSTRAPYSNHRDQLIEALQSIRVLEELNTIGVFVTIPSKSVINYTCFR